jgi:hypothetical protein
MKIKVIWGFKGDPGKTGTTDGRVLAGQQLDVDDEYGYTLVGKGLAAEDGGEASKRGAKAPKSTKPAEPDENK